MKQKQAELLKRIWDHIDNVIAVIIAIVVTFLGLFGIVDLNIVTTFIVVLLGILAYGFFKNQVKFDRVQEKMDKIINSSKSHIADNFFETETDEREIISGADKTLLFIQETGSLITEKNRSDIMTFLNKGGNVKVVVTLPDEQTSQLMALRNANIDAQTIIHRGNSFQAQIKNISENVNQHIKRLEVRYLPYPIGITSVIADPDDPVKKKRTAIVRYADFNVPYEEKLDFVVNGSESEKTFDYYHKQFKKMSLSSHKIVLVTGLPRSGKSTLFDKLIQPNRNSRSIFYVLSREIKEDNERIGFEVLTSGMDKPVQFAQRTSAGSYDLNMVIWDEIAKQLIENKHKIIILDEIGPMQLKSVAFTDAITELIDRKETTIFSTIAMESDNEGYIEGIKTHHRSTNYELLEATRDSLLELLKDELKGSIDLYEKLNKERS